MKRKSLFLSLCAMVSCIGVVGATITNPKSFFTFAELQSDMVKELNLSNSFKKANLPTSSGAGAFKSDGDKSIEINNISFKFNGVYMDANNKEICLSKANGTANSFIQNSEALYGIEYIDIQITYGEGYILMGREKDIYTHRLLLSQTSLQKQLGATSGSVYVRVPLYGGFFKIVNKSSGQNFKTSVMSFGVRSDICMSQKMYTQEFEYNPKTKKYETLVYSVKNNNIGWKDVKDGKEAYEQEPVNVVKPEKGLFDMSANANCDFTDRNSAIVNTQNGRMTFLARYSGSVNSRPLILMKFPETDTFKGKKLSEIFTSAFNGSNTLAVSDDLVIADGKFHEYFISKNNLALKAGVNYLSIRGTAGYTGMEVAYCSFVNTQLGQKSSTSKSGSDGFKDIQYGTASDAIAAKNDRTDNFAEWRYDVVGDTRGTRPIIYNSNVLMQILKLSKGCSYNLYCHPFKASEGSPSSYSASMRIWSDYKVNVVVQGTLKALTANSDTTVNIDDVTLNNDDCFKIEFTENQNLYGSHGLRIEIKGITFTLK